MRLGALLRASVLILGMTMALPSWAIRVEGLYRSELLVAEQSQTLPKSVLSQGLREVLVKVTGRTDVLGAAPLQPLLTDPEPYLQQYSYQATSQPLQTDDGREVLAQKLVLEFDPRLLERQLNAAGFRVLGAQRPALLTWIIEEQNGYRDYLGREEDPALLQMLERASARGLPLYRPLMDLTDVQALPVEEAWGFFQDSIRRASARYRSDAVLTGQVYQATEGWRSRWLLLWNGHSDSFEGRGVTLGEHLQSAVDQSADLLFGDHLGAEGPLEQEGVLISVDRVDSLPAYLALADYLRGLAVVRNVALERAEGSLLRFRVVLDGTTRQLQEALRLNKHLEPVFRIRAEDDKSELDYAWRN